MMQAKEMNYLDGVEWIRGSFIASNGSIQVNNSLRYSDLIPLKPGNYLYSSYDKYNGGSINTRIHGYDENGNWVKQIAYQGVNGGQEFIIPFVITENLPYIRVSTLIENYLDNEKLIDN